MVAGSQSRLARTANTVASSRPRLKSRNSTPATTPMSCSAISACVGACSGDGELCDEDADCDQTDPQTCDLFPNNCHDAEVCNEELGVCPKGGGAGSSGACKEARGNDCTIDDCN